MNVMRHGTYGGLYAQVYQTKWCRFANELAPRIMEFWENARPVGPAGSVLDICCGTGDLAAHFCERGYRVTGIDKSEDMLRIARKRLKQHMKSGLAQFVNADARSFVLNKTYELVVLTYEAMQHLENGIRDVEACLRSVASVLDTNGFLVFDLITHVGTMFERNGVEVLDGQNLMLIQRSIYDTVCRMCHVRTTGFIPAADGRWERFEHTVHTVVYSMAEMTSVLLKSGFQRIRYASFHDLDLTVDDPDREDRVVVIAKK